MKKCKKYGRLQRHENFQNTVTETTFIQNQRLFNLLNIENVLELL